MAVSRILSWMIIYLTPPWRGAQCDCSHRDATIPEDRNGPAALPLFCLAPHGVFRASRIAPRAVSSYLAFSPLPVLFSKNRRCFFCDTLRQRPLSRTSPAYFTRHAAVWCSDFPPAKSRQRGTHQRSSAIGDQLITNPKIWKPGNQEDGAPGGRALPSPLSWIRGFQISSFF